MRVKKKKKKITFLMRFHFIDRCSTSNSVDKTANHALVGDGTIMAVIGQSEPCTTNLIWLPSVLRRPPAVVGFLSGLFTDNLLEI